MKLFPALPVFLATAAGSWLATGALQPRPAAVPAPAAAPPAPPRARSHTASEHIDVAALARQKPGARFAALSRLDSLTSSAEIESLLDQIDTLPENEIDLARHSLLQRWGHVDPARALTWLMDSQDEYGGDPADFALILTPLLERDPARLLQLVEKEGCDDFNGTIASSISPDVLLAHLTAHPDSEISSGLASHFLLKLAGNDPAAALAFLPRLPDSLQDGARDAFASGWADKDPAAALAWAQGLPATDPHRDETLGAVLKSMVDEDPAGALANSAAVPGLVRELLKTWAAKAPEDALKYLATHPELTEAQRDATLAKVAAAIAKTDLPRALALAADLPVSGWNLNYEVSRAFARKDPEAGLTWALTRGNEAPQLIGQILNSVLGDSGQSAQQNPEMMLPWIEKLTALAPAQVGKIVEPSWFPSAKGYQEFLTRLPGRDMDEAVGNHASNLIEKDLPGTAAWLATLPPGHGRDRSIATAAAEWAATDPASGLAWLQTLPDDAARAAAARNLAAEWHRTDPAATATWAATLPPGPQRDAASQGVAEYFHSAHLPAEAWQHAARITDPETRDELLGTILEDWDSAGHARAALDSSTFLSEEKKQELADRIEQ